MWKTYLWSQKHIWEIKKHNTKVVRDIVLFLMLDCVDCLCTTLVSKNNVWLSFHFWLYPGISWGLVTTCMQPKKLDAQIQRVYAKALTFLGVNSNIKKSEKSPRAISRTWDAQHATGCPCREDFVSSQQLGFSWPGPQQCLDYGVWQLYHGGLIIWVPL